MLDFYHQLATHLLSTPLVLATVTHIKGSTPREVGAKMAICSDGSSIGTIGGGAGEAKVIQKALEVINTGIKQFVEIDLSGASHRETQGVCGGWMQIWLERWQGETAQALVNQILELLQSGQTATLITPIEPDQSPYLSRAIDRAIAAASSTPNFAFFSEILQPLPTLLIVGAGHVAIPLAQVAHLAGFRVAVQDDRPEFATQQRFPSAAVILPQPVEPALDCLGDCTQLYAALVTRGYSHDLVALKALIQQRTEYLGMIGSEKRVKTVYQALKQTGIPGMEDTQLAGQLQKIHAPIGLDIGALTPEEIAISICAELIKVRRGGSGLSLAENMRRLTSVPLMGNPYAPASADNEPVGQPFAQA